MSDSSDSRIGSVFPEVEEPPEPSSRKAWKASYTEKGTIGKGGFGRVVRVVDVSTGAELALKEPQSQDDEALRRFRREVQLQRGIRHPNVMPIVDAGYDWFVMPVADTTLAAKASEMFPLEVCMAFEQATTGLQAIHEKGIIHRDIKPENILLLNRDGMKRWVISDFGLVRRPRGETTGPATVGFWGTPDFCAPEALAGVHDLGSPADIYSLGKTMLWVLTGKTDARPPEPWQGLVVGTTGTDLTSRPTVEGVLRGIRTVRDQLRAEQRATWGKAQPDLSDNEAQVFVAVAGCLQIPDDQNEEMAFLGGIMRSCADFLPGGLRIQIKSLEDKGFISSAKWRDAWMVTPAGWLWLRTNQHRVPIKKPPPDDEIPF